MLPGRPSATWSEAGGRHRVPQPVDDRARLLAVDQPGVDRGAVDEQVAVVVELVVHGAPAAQPAGRLVPERGQVRGLERGGPGADAGRAQHGRRGHLRRIALQADQRVVQLRVEPRVLPAERDDVPPVGGPLPVAAAAAPDLALDEPVPVDIASVAVVQHRRQLRGRGRAPSRAPPAAARSRPPRAGSPPPCGGTRPPCAPSGPRCGRRHSPARRGSAGRWSRSPGRSTTAPAARLPRRPPGMPSGPCRTPRGSTRSCWTASSCPAGRRGPWAPCAGWRGGRRRACPGAVAGCPRA